MKPTFSTNKEHIFIKNVHEKCGTCWDNKKISEKKIISFLTEEILVPPFAPFLGHVEFRVK